MSTERLEPSHIKQLLLYAPDDDEVKKYQQFDQDPAKLSEPDKFVLQVHFVHTCHFLSILWFVDECLWLRVTFADVISAWV